jgi:hypothetical protein
MFFIIIKDWATQNLITIKTSWRTNDSFFPNLIYYVIKTYTVIQLYL